MKRMCLFLAILCLPFFRVFASSEEGPLDARQQPPPVTLKYIGPPPHPKTPSLHPAIRLLDEDGSSVLGSEKPLSLRSTCGVCHDVSFIEKTNYHTNVTSEFPIGGWSEKMSARWEPLIYQWYGNDSDIERLEWLKAFGYRVIGGGEFSDVLELNCLLCHIRQPDNITRLEMQRSGYFGLAATATLRNTGLVDLKNGRVIWRRESFDADGKVSAEEIGIKRPSNDNCRLCHSQACRCSEPVLFENSLNNWSAETRGTVFSPARISSSGMNIHGKDELDTPWDVHAERLLMCADCHHSPNNPALDRKLDKSNSLNHLEFDARRLARNEYLWRPDHNLVTGWTVPYAAAHQFGGTMRDCADCHRAEKVHEFLPFPRTHFEALGCSTCHIPRLFTPVRQTTDWTLLSPERQPITSYAGIKGKVNDPASLIEGLEPLPLMHNLPDNSRRIKPHTLLVFSFWVEGDTSRPVRLSLLENALFSEGKYRPEIVRVLDENNNGIVEPDELRLDTTEKVKTVSDLLQRAGVVNPQIRIELRPYTVAHGVLQKDFAIRQCTECHYPDGRLSGAHYSKWKVPPSNIAPVMVGDFGSLAGWRTNLNALGQLEVVVDHKDLYVHGASRPFTIDVLGGILFATTVLGVAVHGLLRWYTARQRARSIGHG